MTRWPNLRDREGISQSVRENARLDNFFVWMVGLSCTVATYGLLSNSTAVVIGAMLIAPLMGPILGGAYSVNMGERELFWSSVKAEAFGVVLAVILSAGLTMILPWSELTDEVMSRTAPTILDLVVALASGAAGTYALCVKPSAAVLPGVAISTALMPPLCTVGIGIAKHNVAVFSGAFLLFAANLVAITVAAIVVFQLAGFRGTLRSKEDGEKLRKGLIYPIVLLLIISIPLGLIMAKTYYQASTERSIRTTLTESLQSFAPGSSLSSVTFTQADGKFSIAPVFRTTRLISPENIRQMENYLELRLQKPVKLEADVVLVQKVDNAKKEDTFSELLPKVKETEIVEVMVASTPEAMVEEVIQEKLDILTGVTLKDYAFSYQKAYGTYQISIIIEGDPAQLSGLEETLQKLLEDKLKRRVNVRIRAEAVENEVQ